MNGTRDIMWATWWPQTIFTLIRRSGTIFERAITVIADKIVRDVIATQSASNWSAPAESYATNLLRYLSRS